MSKWPLSTAQMVWIIISEPNENPPKEPYATLGLLAALLILLAPVGALFFFIRWLIS